MSPAEQEPRRGRQMRGDDVDAVVAVRVAGLRAVSATAATTAPAALNSAEIIAAAAREVSPAARGGHHDRRHDVTPPSPSAV